MVIQAPALHLKSSNYKVLWTQLIGSGNLLFVHGWVLNYWNTSQKTPESWYLSKYCQAIVILGCLLFIKWVKCIEVINKVNEYHSYSWYTMEEHVKSTVNYCGYMSWNDWTWCIAAWRPSVTGLTALGYSIMTHWAQYLTSIVVLESVFERGLCYMQKDWRTLTVWPVWVILHCCTV